MLFLLIRLYISTLHFFSIDLDAIAGIFIRDIAPDSVCARDGRLAIGDQIVEVNDQSLHGFSNIQALYLLQNTSSNVQLKVRRYLDGVKHEKITEMIGKIHYPSPMRNLIRGS